jgi:putative transposase
MMYPLVRELAANGIPVTVTCRVLKIARQPYSGWLICPVTDTELHRRPNRANAFRSPLRRSGVRQWVSGRRSP